MTSTHLSTTNIIPYVLRNQFSKSNTTTFIPFRFIQKCSNRKHLPLHCFHRPPLLLHSNPITTHKPPIRCFHSSSSLQNNFKHILPPNRLGTPHPTLTSFLQSSFPTPDHKFSNQKHYTLIVITESSKRRILLGHKNQGFGKGFYNSFGGKIDPTDESVAHGAVRELREETNLQVDLERMKHSFVGVLKFTFRDELNKEMIVHLFRLECSTATNITNDDKSSSNEGEANSTGFVFHPENIQECDEITPKWYDDWYDIPLQQMFADDSIWLTTLLSSMEPLVLNGWFHYCPGGLEVNSIEHYYVDVRTK